MSAASIYSGASSLYKSHALFSLLLQKPTPLPLPPLQLLSSSLLPPPSVVTVSLCHYSGEPLPCLPLAEPPCRRYLTVLGKPISSSAVHVTSVLISYDYDAVEDPEFYPEVVSSEESKQLIFSILTRIEIMMSLKFIELKTENEGSSDALENASCSMKVPFRHVGFLRETPTLLEAILEPPVADDIRPKPPRNVIHLTLKPSAHLWHPVENRASNLKPRGNKSVSCEGVKGVVYYLVGDGSAHGTGVARSSPRDELDESVSLVIVVAAHGRDHIPHPFHHRHGDAAR
ncbi:hypothetical protein GUJ93_ZPchr0005g14559 [Zizania palustris]|uniref:Uncharacterized protein n=1 Tax=Zizania palustris TaxID=103762 RepID=A0A8J5SQ94_ZIZPA|nr:hypothetical protein GUJ93_ZPchr0005g14559 [Zizania palustris]